MRFRNTLHLFVENFKNVYKILLIKLIVGLISLALVLAMVLPEIFQIGASAEWASLSKAIHEFLFALIPGHDASYEAVKSALFNDAFPAFSKYFWTRAVEIAWISVGCVCVCLVARFFETVCYFALGDTLDDKMQTYGEMTFSSSFVKNFGRASKYSFAYVPFSFLLDVVAVGLCYLVLSFLNIFVGLFLSVLIIVALQSLKLSITCFWMPAMTADKLPLKKAAKVAKTEAKGQFWKTFFTYVVLIYLIIVLNVLAVTCTFASGLIITIPASYVMLICFQYVNYYTVMGRKYFITYQSISVNDHKGDSEHFFDRVLQEEQKIEEMKKETLEEEVEGEQK